MAGQFDRTLCFDRRQGRVPHSIAAGPHVVFQLEIRTPLDCARRTISSGVRYGPEAGRADTESGQTSSKLSRPRGQLMYTYLSAFDHRGFSKKAQLPGLPRTPGYPEVPGAPRGTRTPGHPKIL
jgi:hypothetical protein